MSASVEFKERLKDLQQGPWTERAQFAKQYLQPQTDFAKLAHNREPLDLTAIPGISKDLYRERQLKKVFRWHGKEGISSKREIALRDSFDFALSYLQLLELAVETGYLSVDAIRVIARKELLSLLWSKGARQFVKYYDYVAVEYLANRVGVQGLRAFTPPEPDPNASVRFGSFLSQHIEWLSDENIEEWLGFLDDYVDYEGEQDDFYEYLKEGDSSPSKHFQTLLIGANQFIGHLENLFGILQPNEQGRFGLFYSYWMAKFFGFELSKSGYHKNEELWGDDSWANTISESPLFIPADLTAKDRKIYKASLRKKLKTIEVAWEETRLLIAASSITATEAQG